MTDTLTSRAVIRLVEPGTRNLCAHCSTPIKYSVRGRSENRQVIANVYVDGRWNRTEHWHSLCYGEAGCPYGEAG